jgi:hypothetical protein
MLSQMTWALRSKLFHGVCGRLVAHPLHGDLLPGDTLVRNPHRSSESTELEIPEILINRDETSSLQLYF